ncbi:hypothetical protein YC2023_053638 [Brassica napus]
MRGIGEEQWLGGTLAEMLCRFGVECAMVGSSTRCTRLLLKGLNFYAFILYT